MSAASLWKPGAKDWFNTHVCERRFVQDNHSKSRQGILRGLHYQMEQTQGKLVRVVSGEVFDVAVDILRHHLHLSESNVPFIKHLTTHTLLLHLSHLALRTRKYLSMAN